MRPDDAKQASQPVQRLEHRRDERGVAAVAWENLTNRGFNPADQLLGFLPLLIGHVRFPSASDGRRSSSASTTVTQREDIRFRRPNISGRRSRVARTRAAVPPRRHAPPCQQVDEGLASDRASQPPAAPRSRDRHLRCGRSSSAGCWHECVAGASESVKNRDRDKHRGQRDNRHEDHEAGCREQSTVFEALAVGQHAMDPCRRCHGHKRSFTLGVHSGGRMYPAARMLPACCEVLLEKWERETVEVSRG
jgi:hypothetical protein